MEFFFQVLMHGISVGVLYAVAAIGFVMIYRTSHVPNFAHGGLMAMGAFLFLVFSSLGRLPTILALALSLAGAFVIGLLIEKSFHRTFAGSKPLHGAILTIGLALIFKSLFSFLSGINPRKDPGHLFEVLSVKWESCPFQLPLLRSSSSALCFSCFSVFS